LAAAIWQCSFAQISVSAIVWRMRGEVQKPTAYQQVRAGVAAVCKNRRLPRKEPHQND
jgi:hypothetical protein